MANDNQVSLKFGVSGGGLITGESGREILQNLKDIAQAVENSGATRLKFSIDTKGIEDAGSAIQKNVRAFSLTNVANESKKAMSAATAEMTRAKIATQNVKTEGAKLVVQKQAEAAAHKSNAAAIQEETAKLRLQKAVASSPSGSVNLNSQAVANVSYSNISNTVSDLTKTEAVTSDLTNSFSKLSLAKAAFDNAPTKANLDAYNAQKTAINSVIKKIQEAQSATEKANKQQQQAIHSTNNDLLQYRKILAQVESQYNRYSANIAKIPELDANYQSVISKLKTGIQTGNFDFKDVTDARTQVAQLDNTLTEAGGKVETFTQKLKNLFGIHLTTALTMVGVHVLIQSLQQMMSNIVEIDTAMTELKKVTDETDKTYSNFLDNAAEKAERLGSTISDIVTATADFARLGYALPDASTLAEAATVYKNVGDGITDISVASQSIISTMKAFGMEASSSMSIIDKFNEVGNKYAISSEGIGAALQRSASALAVANNTIEESIALAVGMNDTLQDPEKVGTILKTATMYLRAAKTEAEEAGESTEGMANSVSELRSELLKLTDQKVDIMIDDSTFKSTYEIFKELSGVWKDLADVDQANVLELIGGKRNASGIAGLITNFSDAEKALETASNSAGSALKENQKYLDSIQGKISQFKAEFQDLSTTVINSDVIKGFVSSGTALVSILNNILGAGNSLIPKSVILLATITALTKAQTALRLSYKQSTGRHKMICLINMPVNDLVATRNELVA